VCCSVLQFVAVCSSVMQYVDVKYTKDINLPLRCSAFKCSSAIQYVAGSNSVSHCVEVCFSMLISSTQ